MQNLDLNPAPMIELTDEEIATIQGGMAIMPGGCYPQSQPQPSEYFPYGIPFPGWSWKVEGSVTPSYPAHPAYGNEMPLDIVAD